ncbi:MAG: LysR substrate-binding domain-containing protein, partial [Gammaproteobacteria bacterium]
ELGVPLFERRARGMSLTEAGELLLEFANLSRTRLEDLKSRIQEFEALQRGHVAIATVEGLLVGLVSDFAEKFLREHPRISLCVSALGSHAVAETVAEHRADVGIVFGQSPRRDLLELATMSQPLCAVVRRSHPLAAQRTCRLAQALEHPHVLPDRSFGIRQLIDRVRANGRIEARAAVETNTLAFACHLSLRTDVVTFLPLDAVRNEVAEGRLKAVPLDDELLRSTRVTLVASASRTLSTAATRVADRLRARMDGRDPCPEALQRSQNQNAAV